MGQDNSSNRRVPYPDLSQQRDALLSNFTRGSQLTRDFLDAYDRLTQQVAELQAENSRLRSITEADDAIAQLVTKISALETEKRQLAEQAKQSSAAVSSYPTRAELEEELAHFANLHVASNCLHSTLTPRGVARRITEILEQLIGVEAFVIYLCSPELTPIISHGLRNDEGLPAQPDTRHQEVVRSGISSIIDEVNPSEGSVESPAALIPLRIDDKVVGVLSVVRSLPHKQQLTTVDFELFKLLGQHAAAALMASGLYAQAGRNLPSAEAFTSLQN